MRKFFGFCFLVILLVDRVFVEMIEGVGDRRIKRSAK